MSNTEFPENFECPICLELLSTPVTTNCNHIYCISCISSHYRISTSCPLCRGKLNGVFTHDIKLEKRISKKNKSSQMKRRLEILKQLLENQKDTTSDDTSCPTTDLSNITSVYQQTFVLNNLNSDLQEARRHLIERRKIMINDCNCLRQALLATTTVVMVIIILIIAVALK